MAWLPTWLQPKPAPDSVSPSHPADPLRQDGRRNQERPFLQSQGEDDSSAKSGPNRATSTQSLHGVSATPSVVSSSVSSSASLHSEAEEETGPDYGPTLAIPMTGSIFGFMAGFYTAASKTSLVFMAENAHRRPDTVQGWYFYNKTKNYKVLLGGVKGGIKVGATVGLWTLAWIGIESAVCRTREDLTERKVIDKRAAWNGRWVEGATAGVGIASAAILLYRLPGPVARRALGLGLVAGSSVGALRHLQDELAHSK